MHTVQVVNWHFHIFTVDNMKGTTTSTIRNAVIDCQLCQWQSIDPIANTFMNQRTYNLFNSPLLMFSLTVRLRMVRC